MHTSVVSAILKAKVLYGEEIIEYNTAELGYIFAVLAELICDCKVAANS